MSFIRLILKNLFRQRARTTLTVLGISLGIMTVVALGVITEGLRVMAGDLTRAGGADFIVGQKGSSDLSFSTVPETELEVLAARSDVDQAVGLLLVIRRVESNPFFITLGVDPEQLDDVELEITEGRALDPAATGEILLGEKASADLGIGIGEQLAIDERGFTVVGLYKSGLLWQDKGAIVQLEQLQEISGRTDVVTFVLVRVAPGEDPARVAAGIEESQPALTAVSSAEEYSELDQGLELIDSANVAISLLAIGIGAIGVMNTMVMAVFERTREIGVLRAVGWKGARILRMVLSESLLLCAVATIVGTALGVAASETAVRATSVGGLIEPSYEPRTFVQAVLVAIVVALVGAAYPSYRAIRLTPMEALRHE
jgi:putative ABC transport system permease protein